MIVKVYKLSVIRCIISGNVIYGMVSIVNDIVVYIKVVIIVEL